MYCGVRILRRFYDGLGCEIQTKRESGDSGGSAPQTIVIDTQYDSLGQMTATSQPRYVAETAASFFQRTPVPGSGVNWTTITYDGLGQPLVVTEPDSTTPNGTKTTHTYRVIVDNGVKLSVHNVVDPNRHRIGKYDVPCDACVDRCPLLL